MFEVYLGDEKSWRGFKYALYIKDGFIDFYNNRELFYFYIKETKNGTHYWNLNNLTEDWIKAY